MLSIIEKLLGVVTKLFGLREDLSKAKDTRRIRIVSLLDQVADCLSRVVTDLEADKVPHGACAELATYAGYLPATLVPEIDPGMAALIAHELQEAHNVEALLVQLHAHPNKPAELQKLWEAVGRLHALVAIIKAS